MQMKKWSKSLLIAAVTACGLASVSLPASAQFWPGLGFGGFGYPYGGGYPYGFGYPYGGFNNRFDWGDFALGAAVGLGVGALTSDNYGYSMPVSSYGGTYPVSIFGNYGVDYGYDYAWGNRGYW